MSLATTRFDIWAERGLAVVDSQLLRNEYVTWLHTYAANWLAYVDDTCPHVSINEELKTRLSIRTAHWATVEALAHMRQNNFGRIIMIGSGYSKRSGGDLAYTAAKHGLVGLAKALASKVANMDVTVNVLCPGWTNTDLVDWKAMGQARGTDATEAHQWASSNNLQNRVLEPDELGPMAVLLSSPESYGITGQVISVDGGYKG